MNKLSVDLKDCYGIRSLTEDFDFKARKSYAIYAPNGMMKTSFANTFEDISNNENPKERRHGRTPEWSVQVDGQKIDPDSIYVLPSEFELEHHNQDALTNILVHPNQKAQYDTLVTKLESAKKKLITDLREKTQLVRTQVEPTLMGDWGKSNFPACIRLTSEVGRDEDLSDYKYKDLFNEKAIEVLDDPSFITGAQNFSQRYQELFDSSDGLYQRGTFNPSKAEKAFKELTAQGYFDSGHRVHLRGKAESFDLDLLNRTREKVDATINEDVQLKKLHNNLTRNKERTAIINLIERLSATQLEALLERLKPENRPQFKKNLWTSYVQQSEYTATFLEEHASCQSEIERIEKAAAEDQPIWKKAEERFNARFVDMPYKLKVENPSDVALGRAVPTLNFIFKSGKDETIQTHAEVKHRKILSGGEHRVFYLLNFIFEVESRKRDQRETLFIIDDPADSFDYKNKHAILQYLADLNDVPHFQQIILTHNYDFFRALITNGKGVVTNNGLFMANKAQDETISLKQAKDGVRNYFNGMWKKNVTGNDAILCATIPFTRNLIEYTKDDDHPYYKILTSLLHWRENTEQISVKQYLDIYNGFFQGVNANHKHSEQPLSILLFKQAKTISETPKHKSLALEDKMVLSIAIRIKAEQFLTEEFRRLNKNPGFWLTKEFGKALNKYFKQLPDSEHRELLERVSMVVNSNIHLNAFMYEPIIDLGIETLTDLYDQVMQLPLNGENHVPRSTT